MLQQIVEETNPPCTSLELDRTPGLQSSADPDAALVVALRARTAGAFDELVTRYRHRLLKVAGRITKNREDAEDVVQESFLRVFKKIDSFRGCSKFSTWLIRIAMNQALMLIRVNTPKFVPIDEDWNVEERFTSLATAASASTPEQLYAQRELERVALTSIRKSSRRVMELHVNEGLSELEISQLLSLSLSAVKARLYRGRLDLRVATGRRFQSTRLARASEKMSPAAGRRSNPLVNMLPKAHLAQYNKKPEPPSSWASASRLAGDNPLTAGYGQISCAMESRLPDHFDAQLLTQPSHSSVARPENCF